MKTRHGFVSNSSSLSFICDICNEEASGMDLSIEEAEMRECVNGHITCNRHDIEVKKFDEWKDKIEEEKGNDEKSQEADDFEDHGKVPAEFCPVCRMNFVIDHDLLRYLLVKAGKTHLEAVQDIKNEFSDYESFTGFIDEKSDFYFIFYSFRAAKRF